VKSSVCFDSTLLLDSYLGVLSRMLFLYSTAGLGTKGYRFGRLMASLMSRSQQGLYGVERALESHRILDPWEMPDSLPHDTHCSTVVSYNLASPWVWGGSAWGTFGGLIVGIKILN
jgi:hypothetical protein